MALITPWINFFSTGGEAAATFSGLVVVAVSVNLQQIVAVKHLTARVLGAMGSLVMVLVMGLAVLIPQLTSALAVELLIVAVASWIMHMRTTPVAFRSHAQLGRPAYERVLHLGFVHVQLLPMTIGAILLGLGHGSGLYWIAGAMVAAMIVGMFSVWIFLVAIVH